MAARYARRTYRLNQQQTRIAFSLGGEPGAKLTRKHKMPTSPDTLLRMIREAPEEGVTKLSSGTKDVYKTGN